MAKYKFPVEHAAPVAAHILSYDIVVLSMTPTDDNHYIVETDRSVVEARGEDELIHLQESFNVQEVL